MQDRWQDDGSERDMAANDVAPPRPDKGPTSAQLRDDIDSGRTRDKVAKGDPAAAPLGTDDEAMQIVGGSLLLEVQATPLSTPVFDAGGRQYMIVGSAQARVEIAVDPAPRLVSCVVTGTASLVPLGAPDPSALATATPPAGGGIAICP